MSLIMLYFVHNTSVLSFYIDVVLTLSIQTTPKNMGKLNYESLCDDDMTTKKITSESAHI